MLNFMVNLLNEQNSLKNSNIPEARQTKDSLCDHQQPNNFFSVFVDFRKLPGYSEKSKSVDLKRKN